MFKKIIIIFLITVLLVSPVMAAHTIKVEEKRIENNHYIIGRIVPFSAYTFTLEEYNVDLEDYDKVNIGDTVTLEKRGPLFEITNTGTDNPWWPI